MGTMKNTPEKESKWYKLILLKIHLLEQLEKRNAYVISDRK